MQVYTLRFLRAVQNPSALMVLKRSGQRNKRCSLWSNVAARTALKKITGPGLPSPFFIENKAPAAPHHTQPLSLRTASSLTD